MGRPRTKDRQLLGRKLCERIATGELVKEVCEDLGLAPNAPYRWASDDPEGFGKLYARAREDQAHSLAEQAIQVSCGNDALTAAWERGIEAAAEALSDPASGTKQWRQVVNALEANLVQRNRLRVDTIKWLTSKIAPRAYGERIQQEISAPQGLAIRVIRE